MIRKNNDRRISALKSSDSQWGSEKRRESGLFDAENNGFTQPLRSKNIICKKPQVVAHSDKRRDFKFRISHIVLDTKTASDITVASWLGG